MEAYKDYINNLKEFAHLNNDFELYARDNLKVDSKVDMREIVMMKGSEDLKMTPE